MQLYILNQDYEQIAVIDQADSILWNKKYNDVGECEIYLPCDSEALGVLQSGYYVYRYDDDMFCQIDKIEIETDVEKGDYIIATATDICSVLSGRIIRWNSVYSGNVAKFIEKILKENIISPAQTNRKRTDFVIDTSNFSEITDTIDYTTKNEDVLQLIKTICNTFKLGFRVSFNTNTKKLVFKLYKGKNKATMQSNDYVEFSPAFANMISTSYKVDNTNFKNVVYVSYKTTDEQILLFSKYRGQDSGAAEPQGKERKEVFIDGTNISRDITLEELQVMFGSVSRDAAGYYYILVNDTRQTVATFEVKTTDGVTEEKIKVTDYTYMLLISSLADNELAKHTITQSFSGNVDTLDTYEYKKDYDLGDIVYVLNEYGIGATAQITEIMESEDNENGLEIEPKFEY